MTKSHDALTSRPSVHLLCSFTCRSYRHCPAASSRPGNPPGNSQAWRVSAVVCASSELSEMPCPVLLTLSSFSHLTPRILGCFTSTLLSPSYTSLLLYFHTASPSTVDLKFKLLYNTRTFLTIYLI